jgi:hypothetical protein
MKAILLLFLALLTSPVNAANVTVGQCNTAFAKLLLPAEQLPMIHIRADEAIIDRMLPDSIAAKSPDYLTGFKKQLAINLRKSMVLKSIYRTLNGEVIPMGDLDGSSLLKLLEPEVRYNIVVLKDEIRLIRAVKDPMGDRVSKHIIVANMSDDVRFAGEAWTDGQGNLFVNNNSGTFQPPHSGALSTAEILRDTLQYNKVAAEELDYGLVYAAPKAAASPAPAPAKKPNPISSAIFAVRMAAIAKAEKDRSGQLYNLIAKDDTLDGVVRLGNRLGTGFFGSVYKVSGLSPEPKAVQEFGGPIVAKIPNEYLGIPSLSRKAKGELAREVKAYELLKEKLPSLEAQSSYPQNPAWEKGRVPVVPILHSQETRAGPVIYKAEAPGKTLGSLLKARSGLSPAQMNSLEEIEALGKTIADQMEYVHIAGVASGSNTKFIVDNNPSNLVWIDDPAVMKTMGLSRPSFAFYEITPLRNRSGFATTSEAYKNLHALGIDTRTLEDFSSVETTAERTLAWARRNKNSLIHKYEVPTWVAPPARAPTRLNVKNIFFMQDACENTTQDGKFTVLQNAADLRQGKLNPADIPPIRVWRDSSGKVWTLDHRRLASFRLAGNIPEVSVEWAPEEVVRQQRFKYSNSRGGAEILLDLGSDQALRVR